MEEIKGRGETGKRTKNGVGKLRGYFRQFASKLMDHINSGVQVKRK